MQGVYFDWSIWRGGTLLDLGVSHRYLSISENRKILRKYAIGWCPGESCKARPKKDLIAVMFKKGELLFWTHIYKNEFDLVFKEK